MRQEGRWAGECAVGFPLSLVQLAAHATRLRALPLASVPLAAAVVRCFLEELLLHRSCCWQCHLHLCTQACALTLTHTCPCALPCSYEQLKKAGVNVEFNTYQYMGELGGLGARGVHGFCLGGWSVGLRAVASAGWWAVRGEVSCKGWPGQSIDTS